MLPKREKSNRFYLADAMKRCLSRNQCGSLASPLSKRGETGHVKICKVTGDRAVCGRIAAMGVYPGVEADIICSGTGRHCILKINGGTISLDADVSDNILVTSL